MKKEDSDTELDDEENPDDDTSKLVFWIDFVLR